MRPRRYGYFKALQRREYLPLFWSAAQLELLRGTELEGKVEADRWGLAVPAVPAVPAGGGHGGMSRRQAAQAQAAKYHAFADVGQGGDGAGAAPGLVFVSLTARV